MKAIQISAYGDASVLQLVDIARPSPQAGQALVKMAATTFNPVDAKIRSGAMQGVMPLTLPATLGWDGAGVVEALGEGVGAFKVGDAVYGYPDFDHGGTYADYACIAADQLAPKPAGISFEEAAALSMTAQAALATLDAAGVKSLQRVLIHGGAGAVGLLAVQLAKARGAYVITTASGDDIAVVKAFGADEVIDYKTTAFQDVVRDVDAVIDTVGGPTLDNSFGVVKKGGFVASLVQPPSEEKAKAAGVKAAMVFTQPDGQKLRGLSELVNAGKLHARIGATIPLADARLAHEGKAGKGKIVMKVG